MELRCKPHATHTSWFQWRQHFRCCFGLPMLFLCMPRLAVARIGLAATDLSLATFDGFIQKNDKALIDFFDPQDKEWHSLNAELESAIRDARDSGSRVAIAKVSKEREPELTKKYVPNGPFPQLLWFQNGEATQYHRTLRKAKNILDFVLALDRDPVQAFQNEEEVRKSVNRAVWAQLPKASQMYKVMEVVAAKHMDTVEFAFKDSPGVDGTIRWIEDGKEGQDAIYTGQAEVNALEHWVRRKLTHSESLPEAQDGDSLIVVGQSFEEMVLQKDKDVFLLIYAPWCGFSRKFLPVWESMARRVGHVPHLAVAKMDGDLNGSPLPDDFSWSAYPTIFFVRAGESKPFVFHGNRTLAKLIDFARKHGSNKLPQELDAAEKGLPPVDEAESEL